MKFSVYFIAVLFVLNGCSSDNLSEAPVQEPVVVNWSLSGSFGNATVDSVNADTELPKMVNRSGSSKLHINGFDTTYFEKKITLRHLQVNAGAEVDIDDDGNFTFDNMEVFGLCENTNSIKIIPKAKRNVSLKPGSFILYSYNEGYYQYQ